MQKPAWVDRNVIAGFCLAALSIGFLVFGALSVVQTVSFLDQSISAEGTVVEFERRVRQRGTGVRSVSYATIRFVAGDGQRVEVEQELGFGIPNYSVGERVSLRYLQDDPTKARIDSLAGVWRSAIVGAVASAAAFFGSVLSLRPAFKKRWQLQTENV